VHHVGQHLGRLVEGLGLLQPLHRLLQQHRTSPRSSG
jgi:hypothetical protein